jgi:hypothetical protein
MKKTLLRVPSGCFYIKKLPRQTITIILKRFIIINRKLWNILPSANNTLRVYEQNTFSIFINPYDPCRGNIPLLQTGTEAQSSFPKLTQSICYTGCLILC